MPNGGSIPPSLPQRPRPTPEAATPGTQASQISPAPTFKANVYERLSSAAGPGQYLVTITPKEGKSGEYDIVVSAFDRELSAETLQELISSVRTELARFSTADQTKIAAQGSYDITISPPPPPTH